MATKSISARPPGQKTATPARKRRKQRIGDERLLADWVSVAAMLDHFPSQREYDAHGKYGSRLLKHRFGSWARLPYAFEAFTMLPANMAKIRALAPAYRRMPPKRPRRLRRRASSRPLYGAPLDFDGMRNAPINEQGVLVLFGILARRLGFHIESVQAAFPDCEARRCVRLNVWQTVRIEFEYQSRNFRAHGHPPDGCDIIVCWVHNWADCPKELEVIALSEEIERLGRA